MLICWGELDFVFDKHFLDEWRQRFPEAEVHSFPDCGHYILEDAKDEVVPLIRDFLRKSNAFRRGGSVMKPIILMLLAVILSCLHVHSICAWSCGTLHGRGV